MGAAAFLVVIAAFSVVVMLLWNLLMPDIFGLPVINYWQSLGLSVLARILFGGLGGIGKGGFLFHGGRSREDHFLHPGNPLREKWMNMTEEERKAFLEKEKDFLHFGRKFSRMHEFFDENPSSQKEGDEK
jgi:ABC-type multidrug transport system fused ATPase/permease subunit